MQDSAKERPRYRIQLWAGRCSLTICDEYDREVAKRKARWIGGVVLDLEANQVYIPRAGAWGSLETARGLACGC